jgi:heme/copper-type cytochrome/quinol oxidase subunit 1
MWLYALVALVACLLGVLSVWIGLTIAVAAADDCGVYFDSGEDFGVGMLFLFLLPTVAAANTLLSVLAARRHAAAGLITAALLALVVVFVLVATHALGSTPSGPDAGGYLCPSGLPPWWPWWMPG